jgi:hypothetical protein
LSGSYEQIFFRTESAIRAHKMRGRVELAKSSALEIVIDSAERHAWLRKEGKLALDGRGRAASWRRLG